jgi:hypothetical protein
LVELIEKNRERREGPKLWRPKEEERENKTRRKKPENEGRTSVSYPQKNREAAAAIFF